MKDKNMNAKVEGIINKGKAAVQTGYDKGNGLMDKVPALKSKRNKLIVWGVLAIIVVTIVFSFVGGGSPEERAAAALNDACKEWLCERYGKESIKSYEFESLQWNENRAVLKADVKIETEPSITDPSNEGFSATGTAVWYLEGDGDDVNVVNFEMQ